MRLALSTSWNATRHDNGRRLIFEIKKIGFSRVELSFNLTARMVRDVAKLTKSGQVKVVSLHNFCPIPASMPRAKALPDCLSMSSLDSNQRKRAVRQTKSTIRTAAELNAEAVVLHCGRVEIEDKTRELIKLYTLGERLSRRYSALRQEAVLQRRTNARRYFECALRSLEELNKYASKHRIKLGVETRYYYREIPSFKEIDIILKKFKGSNIYYWHDTGHAKIMEILGFTKQKDFLSLYSKRMLGIHLHDIIGSQDHYAPGTGIINFKSLRPFLSKGTLKVIEAHKQSSQREVKSSMRFLEKTFS